MSRAPFWDDGSGQGRRAGLDLGRLGSNIEPLVPDTVLSVLQICFILFYIKPVVSILLMRAVRHWRVKLTCPRSLSN